ncbi:translation initiation factor IF-2-like [Serinus canaria]|uniref:translation initiation factor IF-2-like n=1 Tax=Serinus canaria TaxID=9135 RepID=UPI0021CCCCA8|nr:translation initiation factor IF-2-like [Serinus canaria]
MLVTPHAQFPPPLPLDGRSNEKTDTRRSHDTVRNAWNTVSARRPRYYLKLWLAYRATPTKPTNKSLRGRGWVFFPLLPFSDFGKACSEAYKPQVSPSAPCRDSLPAGAAPRGGRHREGHSSHGNGGTRRPRAARGSRHTTERGSRQESGSSGTQGQRRAGRLPTAPPCPAGPAPGPGTPAAPEPRARSGQNGRHRPARRSAHAASPARRPGKAPLGSARLAPALPRRPGRAKFPDQLSECPGGARRAPERERSVPGHGQKKRPQMQRHSPIATLRTLPELEVPATEPRN